MRKNILIPIVVLISIVIIGTAGFYHLEKETIKDLTLTDSFYWTIVTITTVGYGDIYPHTEMGKMFSTALMVVGIGAILYTLTMVGRNILEGRIWDFFALREKRKDVKRLKNHLIVCGYGDVGRTITQQILLGSEELVIVDKNEETLREKAHELLYVIGDATREETLEEAKIEKARGLFAALPSEPENILITLSAKDINPDIRIIARAETTEGAKHLRRAGAEAVIRPGQEGGIRMARSFLHPEITTLYDHLSMGDVGRAGVVKVSEGDPLDGMTIKEAKIREKIGVSVMAIKRGEELITNPKVDEEIEAGDSLIIIGTLSQIKKFEESLTGEQRD